jgi:xylulokinase
MVGKKLILPKIDDSSFGTALVGGLGVGLFKSVEEAVQKCVQDIDVIQPNFKNHEIYLQIFEVYKKVSEDLDDASKTLHHVLQRLPQAN